MKRLTLILLALAIFCSIAASGASATVLCKTATNPCTSPYGAKTELHAEVIASVFELPEQENWQISECAGGTLSATTSNAGGAASTVVAPVSKMEFSECGGLEMTVLKPGSLEIHHVPGTQNAVVTSSGAEFTFNLAPFYQYHCIYATNNTELGTLEGGGDPILKVSSRYMPVTTPLCWKAARWTAEFTLTTPSPLYVAAS